MKLLHVTQIHWYNAEVQYAYDLAEAQAKRGCEIHVLTRANSLSARVAAERGFRVIGEDGFNAKGLGFWKALPASGRFKELLKREKYDAVIVHRSEGLPFIAYAAKSLGVPVIRVRGDMRPVRSDPLNRFVYRKLLSGVVASNASIEKDLRDRLGALPRLVTIHGGVDAREFSDEGSKAAIRSELSFPEDTFLVGLLGRLGDVKGHVHFLEGARLALLEKENLGFVLLVKNLAENDVMKAVRKKISSDPSLERAVRITGRRPDLPAVLRSFDLGVVASTGSEANCRVGLEWMACGVPLLATRIGVLPDLVEEGVNGLLVPPADPPAMAKGILDMVKAPERRSRMGREARRIVAERFTVERLALEHEKLLKDILSAGR
ncbi:glycosyltransferase family 1 protein [bacterium]|nr:MAG: glycosyltransferase family 1 protein [bacterium]